MEFSGQYLTYEEYIALGGTLDQMPFNLLEFEARKQIDVRTQNRLKNEINIPQEVKLCVYNLISKIQLYQNDTNRNISSESVGSYSVNYVDNIESFVKNKSTELDDIIVNSLYGVIVNGEHILYIGVD
jgi:hypothetical protein